MPLMVNRHGIRNLVNDDGVADALIQGLRLLDADEVEAFNADIDYGFSVTGVEGFSEGQLGSRIVQVRGKGPSWQPAIAGAFVIDVNGTRDDDADAILCLDQEAWSQLPDASNHVRFYPRGYHMPTATHAFGMPVIDGHRAIRIRDDKATRNAHFSGIAAALVALHLTTGPVAISGFDLTGDDSAGNSYASRQRPAWNAAFACWDRVYPHITQTEHFGAPVWIDQAENGTATVFGGGATATLENLREHHRGGLVLTTNAGIEKIANPHAYWLTDTTAIKQWGEVAAQRGVAIVDGETLPYKPLGTPYHGRSSGVLCCRYLIEKLGVKDITLLGFDGYEGTERVRDPHWSPAMNAAMAQALADIHAQATITWPHDTPLRRMVYDALGR